MPTTTNFINHLAIQTALISDKSLYHGRMGIILALYCYGVTHNNRFVCDYARDVLQTSDDYCDGNIGIENGLAGLGLGFSLLYKAGMFKDNLNDLLFDIDKRIMSVDPRRMEDFSFRKGALGILYYIRTRLSIIDQECISLKNDYLKELEANIQRHFNGGVVQNSLIDSLRPPVWKMKEYLGKDAGIDNGSAYYLIKGSYDKIFSCQ